MATVRKLKSGLWQTMVRKKNYPHLTRSFIEKGTASKTLIVEKPVKPKPLVPEYDWRLGDWTDLLDEDVPLPPPENIEKVLNIKKREVAGLESLLRLHKFVG